MSSVAKGIKKVVKGVGRVVKGVVKGIAKLGKGIVKGVGRFMGKLGPIGTIAMGFLAPMAIGAMAGSSVPWLSSLGKGVQAITSTVTAPFKMAGQAIGKGISGFGNMVGGQGSAFASVTDKIASAVGYQGGTLGENFTNTMNGVKGAWNDGFGTSFTDSSGQVLGEAAKAAQAPLDLGQVQAGAGQGPMGPDVSFDPNAGNVDLMQGATPVEGVAFDGAKAPSLFGDMGPKQVFDPSQADPFTTAEDLQGVDVTKATPDAQYNLDKSDSGLSAKKMLDAAKGLFGSPQQQAPMAMAPIEDSGAFVEGVGAGDGTGGPGGLGQSFYAQDQTGLQRTEDFAERMARVQQSLLGRTA